jgi:hypothetical protein
MEGDGNARKGGAAAPGTAAPAPCREDKKGSHYATALVLFLFIQAKPRPSPAKFYHFEFNNELSRPVNGMFKTINVECQGEGKRVLERMEGI